VTTADPHNKNAQIRLMIAHSAFDWKTQQIRRLDTLRRPATRPIVLFTNQQGRYDIRTPSSR